MMFLTIAEFANKGMVFFSYAYLARVIEKEGFGLFSVASAITSYFAIIINLGFNTVGTRLIAQNNNDTNRVVDSIVTIRTLLGILTLILFLITVSLLSISWQEKALLLVSGINLITLIITLDWVFQGLERMDVIGIRQVVTSLLNLLGYFIFVKTKDDVLNSMIVLVATTFLNSMWMLIYYIRKFGRISFNFDKIFWKDLLRASLPITLSIVFLTVLSNINILMLKAYALNGNQAAGIFNAAYKILVLAILPSSIIQGAFFPILARALKFDERRAVVKDYVRLNAIIGMIVISISIFFSDSIILILFGNDFAESGFVLKILMLSVLMIYLNMSMNPPLLAWGKEKQIMYAVGLAGLINIVANYILIPIFGALGSAYSNIISESSYFIGLSILYYKAVKTSPLKQTIVPLMIALIVAGSSFVLCNYIGYPIFWMIFALGAYFTVCNFIGIFKIKELIRLIKK